MEGSLSSSTAYGLLLSCIGSLAQDSTVWTLFGPAIFRLNLYHAANVWEASSKDERGPKEIDFKFHRFLAYYTLHMVTFILGWILFCVRFFPEGMDLLVSMKGHNLESARVYIYGCMELAVFGWGLFILWIRPKFTSVGLLRAYREHNDPEAAKTADDRLLGPNKPPKANLSYYRLYFLIFSIAAAFFYPLV